MPTLDARYGERTTSQETPQLLTPPKPPAPRRVADDELLYADDDDSSLDFGDVDLVHDEREAARYIAALNERFAARLKKTARADYAPLVAAPLADPQLAHRTKERTKWLTVMELTTHDSWRWNTVVPRAAVFEAMRAADNEV